MSINWIKVAATCGFIGVGIGAFGGHVLKGLLAPEKMDVFLVGIQYHFIHTLALLAIALHSKKNHKFEIACRCFLGGIILFSGSLYLLSITGWTRMGMITPFGGLLFLIGWGSLFISARNTN